MGRGIESTILEIQYVCVQIQPGTEGDRDRQMQTERNRDKCRQTEAERHTDTQGQTYIHMGTHIVGRTQRETHMQKHTVALRHHRCPVTPRIHFLITGLRN